MTRGERFVQDVLRGKSRTRERWIVGAPAALIALLGLFWLARRSRKPGHSTAGAAAKPSVAG